MDIRANFDCGNIVVDNISDSTAALRIRPDSNSTSFQWFYFLAEGEANEKRTFRITNAAQASYPPAWDVYRVLASYDHKHWFRLETNYDGSELTFEHQTEQAIAWYAFFVPYLASQREALLTQASESSHVKRRSIGQSVEGRALDMLVIGDEQRPIKIWMIARQHAGEPMAEWAAEGFISRLLDTNDPVTRQVLEKSVIYAVPNINPDGSTAGNLRANAAGIDLNRAWNEPHRECPEVVAALNSMAKTGVDYFIDMHGDETRPYIWIVPPEVSLPPDIARQVNWFELELAKRNPEIQPPPTSISGVEAGNMGMAVNFIASTYQCPAWTPELPFPEPDPGHDTLLAEGCIRFGRSCLDALNTIIG